MYNLNLTEEELAIIMRALRVFQFNCPFTKQNEFDIAENVFMKISEVVE